MNLTNKCAIVTGSGKGLGKAFIMALLDKGVKVAGWSRSGNDIVHDNFISLKTNVGNLDEVNESYEKSKEFFKGDPDILVNNAGIGYSGLIEELEPEKWTEMFDVNVHGMFYCTRKVIGSMKKRGEGHIINIASIAGKEGVPFMGGYCSTKFAVRGFSQSLYKELRDYGVKVTCITPGSVKTNFFGNIGHLNVSDNMMEADDVASTLVHVLETSSNYHPVEIELRPLMPKGKLVLNKN